VVVGLIGLVLAALGIGGWLLVVSALAPAPNLPVLACAWCVVILVTARGSFWLYERRRRGVLLAAIAVRRERLARICLHKHARERVPHRLVEQSLLDKVRVNPNSFQFLGRKRIRALRQVLALLPKELVVVVGRRGQCGYRNMPVIAVPFEPVDAGDFKAIRAFRDNVVTLHGGTPISDWESSKPASEWWKGSALPEAVRAGKIHRRRQLFAVLAAFEICALAGAVIWAILQRQAGSLGMIAFLPILPISVVIPLGLGQIIFNAHTYLVPGGIVHTRHAPWRKRGKADYARRIDTPLIFDSSFRGLVYIHRKAVRVDFSSVHLAAWLASAPSPSVEAVQALVGDDVELTVA
jgi:hypothetical protein